ncbi:TPA: hypothetical protein RQJ54_002438 [Vibrio vulnificus]|uniref:hypothetical protein n=1 Tax=Vibrio vulnificus TaxID=672 RepID=UPI001CDB7229|nr:hypothetical protein [Vibrio vulnificus]ELK8590239.1 hypothetical protein [Vibrio vulnificus]MCA3966794.1 hypothetical protein [Vibrio vulnificus]MCJ0805540.1 hypothetical protein [Vibrio vulnificus]MDS1805005.1 hypothetical protein [Vibrio vulnificus]HDY7524534.1 hypothetical protein [Vibrio vulnificus]
MNKHILFWSLSLSLLPTYAYSNNCKVDGYTIGFFNGVATSRRDAKLGLSKIINTLAIQQYRGQPVEYALFYNDSNYKERGIDVLADFAETFDQRTNELEQKQFERWEAFWDVVSGRNNSPIIKKIDSLVKGFLAFVNDTLSRGINEIIHEFLEGLASLAGSDINTDEVRMKHRLRNDSQTWQGKKLIYLAHSQGNLWVNESFHYVNQRLGYDETNIKVIHIAPASPTLNGDYILSDKDHVINGLNFTGIGSVPFPNISIPTSDQDSLGHGLVEIYLTNQQTKQMIKDAVDKALDSVKSPAMEDYLFDIRFEYSENYLKAHRPPKIAFVDSLESRDYCGLSNVDYFFDFYGACGNYYRAVEDAGSPYITSERELVVSKKNPVLIPLTIPDGQQPYHLQVQECLAIPPAGSFLLGEIAGIYDLEAPLDLTAKLVVTDRFGREYDIDDRDVSPHREGGYLKCAGTGSFSELVAIQSGYSDDEKRYLKTEQLTGTYELSAQKISHHCGGH